MTARSTPSDAAIGRLCYPLDYPTLSEAEAAAERLAPVVGVFKVGLELFVREGPNAVRQIQRLGRRVFLDLKLHDIPNTVASAVTSAAELDVDYLTLHAWGGPCMLEAAVERAPARLTLLAVTILTSMDDAQLAALDIAGTASARVEQLARMAANAGVGGLVCSTHELDTLRGLGRELTLVTPGIRPTGTQAADQKRIATPAAAIKAGSDLIVVGRPIRNASDPLLAATEVALEIDSALSHGADA